MKGRPGQSAYQIKTLSQWIDHRAKTIVVAWALLIALAAITISLLAHRPLEHALTIKNSESGHAAALIHDHVRRYNTTVLVALTVRNPNPYKWRARQVRLYTNHVRDTVERTLRGLPYSGRPAELAHVTAVARPPSKVKTVSIIAYRLGLDAGGAQNAIPTVRAALERVKTRAVDLDLLGTPVLDERYAALVQKDVTRAERLALPLTAGALLVAFISVTAALLPVVLAMVTCVVTLAVLYIFADLMPFSATVTSTITILGLGLSIDYALFFVTRFREERVSGLDVPDAVGQTMATTGRAILLSGTSLGTALLSLTLVGIGDFTSMAVGGVVCCIVAVAAALTLMPAMLLMGRHRLDRFSVRWVRIAAERQTLWRRLARTSADRPLAVVIISLGILIPFAAVAVSLQTDTRTLRGISPDTSVTGATRDLTEAFGPGASAPVSVITTADPQNVIPIIERTRNIDQTRITGGASGWSLVQFTLKSAPDSPITMRTVSWLRHALDATREPAYVGGLTATRMDMIDRLHRRTPFVVAVATLIGFLVLVIGLRSLVIPLKAVLGTLLSVAAALGIMVIVLPPKGEGHSLEPFVPLLVFTVTFGLSVDYEVLLLSRVREEMLKGASTRDAIVTAVTRSGRPIVLAGACLAIMFGALGMSSLATLRQLGAGVAIAVSLDVSLVRCLLVPAGTILLKKWNWWLPGTGKTGLGVPF